MSSSTVSPGMTSIFSAVRVSVVPAGSEYDEEEVDYEESDSDESWTTESAISSESILSSMCMNGGEEKPFACPVPGCKKRYKVTAAPHRVPNGPGRSVGVSRSPHWGFCLGGNHMFGTHYYKIASIPNAVMGGGLGYIMVYLLWLKFITPANRSPFQRRAARALTNGRGEEVALTSQFSGKLRRPCLFVI